MRRGPLYMVGASLLFTLMVGAVKLARAEMGPFEVIVWRSATALPLAWVLARHTGEPLRIRSPRVLVLRALLGFGAMSCFFTAARGLALADLSIVSKLQPIAVAIAAPMVLGAGERSGPRLWVAMALGLAGCALIVGPDLAVGSWYGVFALVASLLSAGAHVSVRHLGKTEAPLAIVFWFQVATLLLALGAHGACTGDVLPIPPAHLWPWLAVVGVTATAGQVLMTRAYAIEKAPPVAAAAYTGPLFGVIGDIVAFGTPPSGWVIAGGVLVVGAGLLLILSRDPAPPPVRPSSPPGHSGP